MTTYMQQSLMLVGMCSIVPLLVIGLVSVVVSIIQAVTQIQDQTLPFLVRLVILCAIVFACGGFGMDLMREHFFESFRLMILAGR